MDLIDLLLMVDMMTKIGMNMRIIARTTMMMLPMMTRAKKGTRLLIKIVMCGAIPI